jgi:hypothetical protein
VLAQLESAAIANPRPFDINKTMGKVLCLTTLLSFRPPFSRNLVLARLPALERRTARVRSITPRYDNGYIPARRYFFLWLVPFTVSEEPFLKFGLEKFPAFWRKGQVAENPLGCSSASPILGRHRCRLPLNNFQMEMCGRCRIRDLHPRWPSLPACSLCRGGSSELPG